MNTLKYEDENEKLRRQKKTAKTRRWKHEEENTFKLIIIEFSSSCFRIVVIVLLCFHLRTLCWDYWKKKNDGSGGTPQYTATLFIHSCLSIRRTKILRLWIKIVHSLIILQGLLKYGGTLQYFKCWLPTPPENITGKQFTILIHITY